MAKDKNPEIRGQAAWLLGIRSAVGLASTLRSTATEDGSSRAPNRKSQGSTESRPTEMDRRAASVLIDLLNDKDQFVRRRAAEAFTRVHTANAVEALIERLSDSERVVRYVATIALAHRPTSEWFEKAVAKPEPQIRMRALMAAAVRRELPIDDEMRRVLQSLLVGGNRVIENRIAPESEREQPARGSTPGNGASNSRTSRPRPFSREDRLDLLRLLAWFRKQIEDDPELKRRVAGHLLKDFPSSDRDIRFEQVRLLGEYRITESFPKLLELVETERDEVTRFHVAQAISRLSSGWTADEEERLFRWMLGTQTGWFAQFDGKGVEFPLFWSTVLYDFARHHRDALLRDLSKVNYAGLLGGVVIDLLAEMPNATESLIGLYRRDEDPDARARIASAFRKTPGAQAGAFLREEFFRQNEPRMKGVMLQSLAVQPADPANLPLLLDGLRHPDVDVVRSCAGALVRYKPDLDEPLANLLVSRLAERRSLFYVIDRVLVTLSDEKRPGHKPEPEPGERLEESTRSAAIAFWKDWYERRFAKKFEPLAPAGGRERSDEDLHRLIVSADFQAGDTARGAKVYERLQCNSCHGAGVTPGLEGRLFGPDLAGVTRRLSRPELADGMVYPSKQVADRFKAHEVRLNDGEPLAGFITEQTGDTITLAARDQVHRIPRSRIRSIEAQTASLMPERLLSLLTDEEILDLLSFLDHGIGSSGATAK